MEIGLKLVCFVFAPFCLKLLDESPQVAIRFVMAMPREPTSSTPVVMEAPEISSKKSRENHHGSQEQCHWSMTSNTVVKQPLGAQGRQFDI